jgi:cysteine desulfurase
MRVYLDSHSTTPLDPKVLKAMLPYLTSEYANPSAAHSLGVKVREAVEQARANIAVSLNAQPDQLYFTSGASESNNLAIHGFWDHARTEHTTLRLVSSNIEHPSVAESMLALAHSTDHPTYYTQLDVLRYGWLSDFGHYDLCSVQAANHEIGTVFDLEHLGRLCRSHGTYFHTDATQAIGKVPINVESQCIDALSFSGHKLNGPKGIGALYVRDYTQIEPLLKGGLQERLRSGTLNIPGIIGLAKALELTRQIDWGRVGVLRDLLLELLQNDIPDLEVNGPLGDRLPHNLNVSIPGIKSEVFVRGLEDVIVSAGSACQSGKDAPSHILTAIGAKYPDCAIRFGLGKDTTKREVQYAAKRVIQTVKSMRQL